MRARALAALLVAGLVACAAAPSGYRELAVREVGRSAFCGTQDALPRAELLADAAAVRRWQVARGVELVAPGALRDRPHVLVELGPRPTGGYGLALDPAATANDGRLSVVVIVHSPAPGAMVSQALTSPCVLGELPGGDYRSVEVRDGRGTTWIGAPGRADP